MAPFALLLAFDLAGLAAHAAGFPLPAHVTGLLLLAAALFTGLVKADRVRPATDVLLRHLVLFFAPAIAAVVVFGRQLSHEWLPVTASLVVATVAATVVAGWVSARLRR